MSKIVRIALAVGLLVALALGGIHTYDRLSTTEPTYETIPGPSALDTWQPPEPVESELAAESTVIPECADTLPRKWMVIGWDGAEWELILPMLERGELPNFAALMAEGTYGDLESFEPSISPAIWTTVATGVPPSEHGILHFYNQRPRLERLWNRLKNFGKLERYLFSNADRRTRAIWNELSDRGRTVMVVGYHNTFPVEEVQGLMVSNYLMQDSIGDLMQMRSGGDGNSPFALSLVYPQEHLERLLAIQEEVNTGMPEAVRRLANLDDEQTFKDFIRASRELPEDGDQRPYFLTRAYVFDEIAAVAAERFYAEVDPDLFMVHFQGLDWAAHQFLYFHYPERFADMPWDDATRRELDAMLPLYRGTVEAFYRHQDAWLGRFLALRDPSTAVLILSDHGMGPGPDPDVPGYHDDAPTGMFLAHGPGIRPGQRLADATIYDILPTLMAGMELPVAEDLPGKVLEGLFCDAAWQGSQQSTVASYQSGERYVPAVAKPPELDAALVEQLESLGYIK